MNYKVNRSTGFLEPIPANDETDFPMGLANGEKQYPDPIKMEGDWLGMPDVIGEKDFEVRYEIRSSVFTGWNKISKETFELIDHPDPNYKRIVAYPVKQEQKRNYEKFFTYPDTAKFMADILDPKDGEFVLEPSAGNGSLVKAAKHKNENCIVVAYEIDSGYEVALRSHAGANMVIIKDFLTAESLPKFSSCIANPPFGNGVDLQAHFNKICSFVKEGGKIVMIVPKWFTPIQTHKTYPLENWSKNSDGTTTEIKIISLYNYPPQPIVNTKQEKGDTHESDAVEFLKWIREYDEDNWQKNKLFNPSENFKPQELYEMFKSR